jgi:hypothetical protein
LGEAEVFVKEAGPEAIRAQQCSLKATTAAKVQEARALRKEAADLAAVADAEISSNAAAAAHLSRLLGNIASLQESIESEAKTGESLAVELAALETALAASPMAVAERAADASRERASELEDACAASQMELASVAQENARLEARLRSLQQELDRVAPQGAEGPHARWQPQPATGGAMRGGGGGSGQQWASAPLQQAGAVLLLTRTMTTTTTSTTSGNAPMFAPASSFQQQWDTGRSLITAPLPPPPRAPQVQLALTAQPPPPSRPPHRYLTAGAPPAVPSPKPAAQQPKPPPAAKKPAAKKARPAPGPAPAMDDDDPWGGRSFG